MQFGWWGITVYLTSRVKSDPTDRDAARLLAVFMSCVVAFLVGVTLGSWAAGLAVYAVLLTVLFAVARSAQPGG